MHRLAFRSRQLLPALLITVLVAITGLPGVQAQDGAGNLPPTHKIDVSRLRHEYQGWNNCGPTTMTMGLSYFGYSHDQYPAANYMKPHREDKNVSPWEMVEYVNAVAANDNPVQALWRPGGNLTLIKTLLAADFPVIVEKGYEPEGYDWMGHYLLLIGYNDTEGYFYTYDSFSGHGNFQGLPEDYEHMSTYWWHFNNIFIVLYEPDREAELQQLLGDHADLDQAFQIAATEAQQRLQSDDTDAWAWFNIGDALTHLGRFEQATDYFRIAFERGLPWRTLWYRHSPLEAFYQTGDFDRVLEIIEANLRNTPYVEEWYYYRGLVYASRGDTSAARNEFNQALIHNTRYQAAEDALNALENSTFQSVQEQTN